MVEKKAKRERRVGKGLAVVFEFVPAADGQRRLHRAIDIVLAAATRGAPEPSGNDELDVEEDRSGREEVRSLKTERNHERAS